MISRRVRCAAAVATASLAALIMTGCAQNTTEMPNLNGPNLTGAPGVAPSPEQQATDGATATVNRYYDVLSRVATTATADPGELDAVVSGDYRDQIKHELDGLRVPGAAVTGKIRAVKVTPGMTVVAPQDEHKDPVPGQARVELKVCEDRSGLTVTGVPSDKLPPQTRLRRFLVVNPSWPGSAGWTIERQYVPFPNTSCNNEY